MSQSRPFRVTENVKQNRHWRWMVTGAALLIAALLGLYWWTRQPPPILPANPAPYVKQFTFTRLESGEPIGDVVTLLQRTGFYANVDVTPNNLPGQIFADRELTETVYWPMTLAVIPRGWRGTERNTIEMPCIRYRQQISPRQATVVKKGSPKPTPLAVGNMKTWPVSAGYSGSPKKIPPLTKGNLCGYTFFALGNHPPGEYVYELRIYPTAHWISDVRFESGPPLVLQRGLLQVTGDEQPQ